MGKTWTSLIAFVPALWACDPGAEFRAALPDEDSVTVPVPEEGSTQNGLSSTRSALVGEKADFQAQTYYTARDINLLGKAVVDLVEGVSRLAPTTLEENRAVWGPFSDSGDPNEFKMTVDKIGLGERYDWRIEGKHKADAEFLVLAAGTFEPQSGDFGRGWFHLDFDAVGALDPTEDARGLVAYAFEKSKEGVSVRLRFKGPNEAGERIEAGYAFGEDENGGFILFAYPGDIDENGSLPEDVVIRSRWTEAGAGRADVFARNGDLDDKSAQASQCWDERFISRYEMLEIEGTGKIEVGDARECTLAESMVPTSTDLPKETDVENPFE